ncbi:MAG: FeoB-associated Cys-rich membrane protein [Tannerellaceae bacterium]
MWQEIAVFGILLAALAFIGLKIYRSLTTPKDPDNPCIGCTGCKLREEMMNKNKKK